MDFRKTCSNASLCLKVQERALFFYTALKAAAQAFDILLAVTATLATLIATFISPPLALTIYACTMPLSLASFFWLIVMDITDFCKGKNIKKEIEQNNNTDAIFQEIMNRDKKTPSKLAVRVLCQLHFEVADGANLKKSLDISATIQRDKLALKVLGYAIIFFTKALPPFSLARETVYWVNSGLWLAYTIKSTYLTKPS
jgi:hypothetical protein